MQKDGRPINRPHGLLAEVLAAGMHVLWRAKSDIDLPVLEVFSDGTYRSRIADPAVSRQMRRQGVDPQDIPGIDVRVIEYSVTSEDGSEVSETFTLVTDILDPKPPHSRAGRDRLRAALAAGNLLRRAGNLDSRGCRRGSALQIPTTNPTGDLRDALLLALRQPPNLALLGHPGTDAYSGGVPDHDKSTP